MSERENGTVTPADLRRHAAHFRAIAERMIGEVMRRGEPRDRAAPEARLEQLYAWRDRCKALATPIEGPR